MYKKKRLRKILDMIHNLSRKRKRIIFFIKIYQNLLKYIINNLNHTKIINQFSINFKQHHRISCIFTLQIYIYIYMGSIYKSLKLQNPLWNNSHLTKEAIEQIKHTKLSAWELIIINKEKSLPTHLDQNNELHLHYKTKYITI
jgi:hypothetical protein